MNLAPASALFTRSLMLRTRSLGGAWGRLALGGILGLVLLGFQSALEHLGNAPGRALLISIAWTLALALPFITLSLFSSTITEEKEDRTIGLLRMTGLGGLAILLAKVGVRLIEALVLMAVTLPLAMLAVILGGVTAIQVLAIYVALASWLLLLAGLGLFWSVLCRTTPQAVAATLVTLVGVPVLLALVTFLSSQEHRTLGRLVYGLGKLTIFYRIEHILRAGFAGAPVDGGDALHAALASVFFVAAWWLFPRFVADDEGGETKGAKPVQGRRPWWRRLLGGNRRPRPGLAALLWKDQRFICGGRAMWLVRVALVGIVFLVICTLDGGWPRPRMASEVLMTLAGLLLVAEVGVHCCRLFGTEVHGQTADGILGLPFKAMTLFYAKLRVLIPAFVVPLMLVLVAWMVDREMVERMVADILRHGVFLAFIAVPCCFWHWCLYLSLVLRRGAFVASAIITGLMLALFFLFIAFSKGFNNESEIFISMAILFGGCSIVVHLLARARFSRLGSGI